jgi:putative phosphoesterase
MNVVVLSDTHAKSLDDLPAVILKDLKETDWIIHAGDYTSTIFLEQLRGLGNFTGVHGNMDSAEIRGELPEKDIVGLHGVRIGIAHPSEGGSPFGLKKRVKSKLGADLDMIIYGHSHKPANERVGGTIYFNPGSATGAFPARYKTYGVLRIEGEIEGEIVRV